MDKPSVKDIFLAFLKAGTLAFGGVYSMLSMFEREFVEKRQWVTSDEYLEAVALGQMTPGPPIVNTGICLGYRLGRLAGALAATIGQTFPGIVTAILLAAFYTRAADNVLLKCVMKGIGAAVVGLLASVVLRMARKSLKEPKAIGFAVCAFVALFAFKVNAILVILAACALGLLVYRQRRAS